MEISGKIKKILDTQTFASGLKKRELIIITEDKYPQHILVEFLQKNIHLLDRLKINDYIKILINIRGREWMNSKGIIKHFNSIQGWRVEKIKNKDFKYVKHYSSLFNDFYDLPF